MLLTVVVGAIIRLYQPVPLTLGAWVFGGLGMFAGLREARRHPHMFRRRALLWLRRAFTGWGPHGIVFALMLLTAFVYGLRAWLGVRLPASDWDGLMYHLVAPSAWVQAGEVGRATEVIWADAYPMGVESLAGWPMVFLGFPDYGILYLLPGYLLAGVALVALARRLGLKRAPALLVGTAFLLTPSVFAQANTYYVDVQSAAFGLAALAVLASMRGAAELSGRPTETVTRSMLVLGFALGAATATKSSNLAVMGVAGCAAIVAVAYLSGRHRLGLWPYFRAAPALIVPIAVIGGYWYLRTWLHYDNPFYPVTMLGFEGLGSVEDVVMNTNVPLELRAMSLPEQLWASWSQPFTDLVTTQVYDVRLGGLGIAWMTFVLPVSVLGILLWIKNSWRKAGVGSLLLLGIAATYGPSLAPWWGRYVLLGYGCLLIFAVYFTARLAEGRSFARVSSAGLRFVLAASVALAVFTGHRHVPITTGDPADKEMFDRTGGLPLERALALTVAPDRAKRVWPWTEFGALDSLPNGTVIAVARGNLQSLLQPLRGTWMQRDLVVVEPPPDVPTLIRELREVHADHVLLDRSEVWDAVRDKLADDPSFTFVTDLGGVAPRYNPPPNGKLFRLEADPDTRR
ncbi:phospholipid carrier-dependent glycosyltransferase [Actinocorallia herbida]|nr:phospholipid carrier-dependent glycosyltransferase [Actinocorallia herbida]